MKIRSSRNPGEIFSTIPALLEMDNAVVEDYPRDLVTPRRIGYQKNWLSYRAILFSSDRKPTKLVVRFMDQSKNEVKILEQSAAEYIALDVVLDNLTNFTELDCPILFEFPVSICVDYVNGARKSFGYLFMEYFKSFRPWFFLELPEGLKFCSINELIEDGDRIQKPSTSLYHFHLQKENFLKNHNTFNPRLFRIFKTCWDILWKHNYLDLNLFIHGAEPSKKFHYLYRQALKYHAILLGQQIPPTERLLTLMSPAVSSESDYVFWRVSLEILLSLYSSEKMDKVCQYIQNPETGDFVGILDALKDSLALVHLSHNRLLIMTVAELEYLQAIQLEKIH